MGDSEAPYEDDLAHIHAAAFGDLAARAAEALLPRLIALEALVSPVVRASPARLRVIDVGCGSGVTTRALTGAGFDTLAIEPSRALLALARAAAPEAHFRQESAYEAELPPCDAILAVGEPLSYHPPGVDGGARLRSFFANAAAALSPGGLLVLDLILADDAGESLDRSGWRSESDWAILFETREDRAARRLTRTIETFRRSGGGDAYRRAREVHHVQLFEERAIASALRAAGFSVEVARAYGDFPLLARRAAFFATRCDAGLPAP
jgi:SAM-dependent methyltransferase